MKLIIDIPDSAYEAYKEWDKSGDATVSQTIIAHSTPYEEQPTGECRTCRHRDPEDKKCDCGGQERQGCLFPVSDDYFCKFYKKGGEEK